VSRRPYTPAERTDRGLDEWHNDPEMFTSDMLARIRLLEKQVARSELEKLFEGRRSVPPQKQAGAS
jgi:hypothetical protein